MVEAIAPRKGELRSQDLRAAYGQQLAEVAHVDVVVVADAGVPVAASLELGDVACGSRTRRAMLCPACGQARHLLLAREGALKCSQCHRRRTRRQLENHRADFQRRGGLQEDRLLRLMLTPSRRGTSMRLQQARRLVRLLLRADRARVAALRARLEDLKVVAATT